MRQFFAQAITTLIFNVVPNLCKTCKMQLLVRTEASQARAAAAQTQPPARPPYSKAYQQQSQLLRELELQHANHKHIEKALLRRKTRLSMVESDNSLALSAELLRGQVQSLTCQITVCQGAIATLRSRLDLNTVDPEGLEEDGEQDSSTSILSASSEVFDFAIDWPTSLASAPANAYWIVLDQELAEELEKASLDAQDNATCFVPAGGWEKVLGTWV